MIVSWNWLNDYVPLDMSPDELAHRLAMAGLNHEGSEQVGDDLAVDLEVTSNRPDCLGHLGVAREVSVLWKQPLLRPDVDDLDEQGPDAAELIDVSIEAPELCPQYSARVIQGVKIANSPQWLIDRLTTLGQQPVNNIVDITNYVLLECGQPLHAFDLQRIAGRKIVVRRAGEGEQLEAIDHNTYELDREMCVIADAQQAVALAGVMGGAGSEVGPSTVDLLIEAAEFNQLATRTTSRRLKLQSESSHRFERGIDPLGVDWASRRCCQLILELAGGTLATGAVVAGGPVPAAPPVVLRLSQVARVLGIEIGLDEIRHILTALGFEERSHNESQVATQPPSWRRDCRREIDLIEEVARIHGYEEIPEDTRVPMTASARTPFDQMIDRVRQVLVGAGFFEAMTVTVTPRKWNDAFNPWRSEAALETQPSMLRGAGDVRHSIVPSLLDARKYNDSRGNLNAELFETARVFVVRGPGRPQEPRTLAMVGSRGFLGLKGVLEAVAGRMGCQATVGGAAAPCLLAPGRSAEILIDGRPWGFAGEVSDAGLKLFGLQRGATVAEVSLETLAELAQLVPQDRRLSEYPAMEQDLNFIVPESLAWADLAATVRESSGELLESVAYKETYRDAKQDGPGRKRQLFTIVLRSMTGTLTHEQAEQVRQQIIAAMKRLDGVLLG